MAYSADQVAELLEGVKQQHERLTALVGQLVTRQFQTERAGEYATHGLSRRLNTLQRCVDRVFDLLPPGMEKIPARETTVDATINIQAFVFNAFGCCENLAWIWVHEKNVTEANGRPLAPGRVGLGPAYPLVRNSFPPAFVAYLDDRARWFAHLKDFRDALAHRIPLYIPPFTVDPAQADAYRDTEAAANAALVRRDFGAYEQLFAEQRAFEHFMPVVTHSFTDRAPIMRFHPQLLADAATVEEMVVNLLKALDAP